MKADSQFLELYEIIKRLRGPGGCPWDQKQTPASLRAQLLEEVYETIEAVDSGSDSDIREEIGDVFLLIVSLAVMYEEQNRFSVADALQTVSEKLVRRHPHVFGNATAETPEEVVDQWNRIKVEEEGKREKNLLLDSVSTAQPALERASKLQRKASRVGFDWSTLSEVIGKLQEEIREVEEEDHKIRATAPREPSDDAREALETEVGDLLFSAVNVSRFLGVDPSVALHKANQKFSHRFGTVETTLASKGLSLDDATLDQMEEIWNSMR